MAAPVRHDGAARQRRVALQQFYNMGQRMVDGAIPEEAKGVVHRMMDRSVGAAAKTFTVAAAGVGFPSVSHADLAAGYARGWSMPARGTGAPTRAMPFPLGAQRTTNFRHETTPKTNRSINIDVNAIFPRGTQSSGTPKQGELLFVCNSKCAAINLAWPRKANVDGGHCVVTLAQLNRILRLPRVRAYYDDAERRPWDDFRYLGVSAASQSFGAVIRGQAAVSIHVGGNIPLTNVFWVRDPINPAHAQSASARRARARADSLVLVGGGEVRQPPLAPHQLQSRVGANLYLRWRTRMSPIGPMQNFVQTDVRHYTIEPVGDAVGHPMSLVETKDDLPYTHLDYVGTVVREATSVTSDRLGNVDKLARAASGLVHGETSHDHALVGLNKIEVIRRRAGAEVADAFNVLIGTRASDDRHGGVAYVTTLLLGIVNGGNADEDDEKMDAEEVGGGNGTDSESDDD